MKGEGPALERLLHRLVNTPGEFLKLPMMSSGGGDQGRVAVGAIVSDMLRMHGEVGLGVDEGSLFVPGRSGTTIRSARVALLLCWLLTDESLRSIQSVKDRFLAMMKEKIRTLADCVEPEQFVDDSDRREELVRVLLAGFELRPEGETVPQATDRLATLDSVERTRILKEAKEAEERARQVREAMKKKAAEAAAAKVSRE
jgi:hypothetical protein